MDPNIGKSKILVWLVDAGREEIVQMIDMRELNPSFSAWSALAFKSHLVHIQPNTANSEWSQGSILAMKEICPSRE